MKKNPPQTLTKAELAAIFGVAVKTITSWQSAGLPVKREGAPGQPNAYDALDVLKWAAQRMKAPRMSLDEERALLAAEQRKTAELRNAKAEGSQIDLEAAVFVATRAAFVIRQRIVNLSLPAEEKRALLAEIHALGETDFSDAEKQDERDAQDVADEVAAEEANSPTGKNGAHG